MGGGSNFTYFNLGWAYSVCGFIYLAIEYMIKFIF